MQQFTTGCRRPHRCGKVFPREGRDDGTGEGEERKRRMDGYKGTVRERGRKTQVLNQASQRETGQSVCRKSAIVFTLARPRFKRVARVINIRTLSRRITPGRNNIPLCGCRPPLLPAFRGRRRRWLTSLSR